MRCWLALTLVQAVWADGVTRTFHRPPTSDPLSRAEALQKLSLHAQDTTAIERQRSRLMGASVPEAVMKAWALDVDDPVQQVHLAPGGPGEAVVAWLTAERGAPSVVHYSKEGSYVSMSATGQAKVYTTQICLPNSVVMSQPDLGPPDVPMGRLDLAAMLNTSAFLPSDSDSYSYLSPTTDPWALVAKTNFCIDYKNPLAYYTSPYIHAVVLSGLAGRTNYVFKPEGSSRSFSFRTPAALGADLRGEPFRLGVWADVGVTNISFTVMAEMLRLDPELVLTVGDLSYADGWAHRWDIFGTMMEPLLSSRYQLAVVGNHEMTMNNGVDFLNRYPMPTRQSGSESDLAFSYEAGPVFVIGSEGSYAGTDKASAQWNFIADKLKGVDRERTPWVVVMFHTPWYNSNKCHHGEGLKHQWDMEELLYQYGVDIVVNGHIHSYERSYPVFKNVRDQCGIVHIVIGDGGNYEGPAVYEGSPAGWQEPQPSWSAFREAAYGPGILKVHNATHAEWEWRRVACVQKNTDYHRMKYVNGTKDKYSYGGTRQSLQRTHPQSRYVWDGISGPEGGPTCATDGDDSAQRYETADTAMLVRDPGRCPNKAKGSGQRRAGACPIPTWLTSATKISGLTTEGRQAACIAVAAFAACALSWLLCRFAPCWRPRRQSQSSRTPLLLPTS